MLDIFVGESLAARTLGKANTLPQRPVIRLAIGRVEGLHRCATRNTDGHAVCADVQSAIVCRNNGISWVSKSESPSILTLSYGAFTSSGYTDL